MEIFNYAKRGLLTCLLVLFYFVSFAQIPQGYYSTADGKSGEELKTALYDIIKGHIEYPYTSSSTDVWDILKETDRDPNNPANVVGLYSGFSMDAAAEYNSGQGWNREHVWAKSRGDFGTTMGAGTDVHHLRAADISTNSARNNRTFAECSDQYIDGSGTYQGPTESYTSSTEFVWMPRASVKGDVARMIFYMATRYEGFNGELDLEIVDYILDASDKSPVHGRLSELLAWHTEDPVDQREIERNDITYSYQQNRNPYIDHPEYVNAIWGDGTTEPQPLAISSQPETQAYAGQNYVYDFTTSGGENAVNISATQIPAWLSFADNADGTATLNGTPQETDLGNYNITIEATDGVTLESQSFTLNVDTLSSGNSQELFISEYIEGSSYNKALEIANFTDADVDLTGYVIKKQTNGSGSWSSGLALAGTLVKGDVFVIAHSSADGAILAEAELATGVTEMIFNGNDAVALFKNDVLIDILGVFNDGTNFAQDVTKVRNSAINAPNSTYTESEWDNYPSDTFNYLGTHSVDGGTTPSNEAPSVAITSPADNSTFTEGNTISIEASASDNDGSISKVVFYEGSNLLGEVTSAPYTYDWANVVEGNYQLSATAIDNEGAESSSSIVNVAVEAVATNENMISSISLSTNRKGKNYEANADISITSNGNNVSNALVEITWSSSDGSYVETQSAYTTNSGISFLSSKLKQNDFTITINNVSKTGYTWDQTGSDLSASTYSTNKTSSATTLNSLRMVEVAHYPNPFTDVVNFEVHTQETQSLEVRVINSNGKVISHNQYSASNGFLVLQIGKKLKKGMYAVQFITGNSLQTYRILKK